MSHEHASTGEHKPHVLPIRIYLGVWVGLMILTYVTVKVSYFDLGSMNIVVAMGVATVKASLVLLFFMHLKYDEGFNKVVFLGSLAFLGVFFILTLADTAERGKVDPLEAEDLVPVPARPELWETTETDGHGEEATGEADGHGEEASGAESHGEEAAGEGDDYGETGTSKEEASGEDDAGGH